MMPAVVTPTDLAVTASEIHNEHQAAQRCASEAVTHAIRAGELLIQAKAALPHGAFGSWLSTNVEFSDRTSRGYMQLAGLDEAKRQRVADLSLRSALAAIADQRDRDRPVRSFTREEIEAMSGSERDALRRECLDTAARNMQDILALKIIPPPADIPYALKCVADCEDMLVGVCAASPPGQFALGMMLAMQCGEIRSMLTRVQP